MLIHGIFLPLLRSRLFHRSAVRRKGKSGQHRAPYFLTGRYPRGYSSVTENNRHRYSSARSAFAEATEDKGEKVR